MTMSFTGSTTFRGIVLLTVCVGLSASAGRRGKLSECSEVKDSFLTSKPTVAETILDSPAYDGSLQLCKFTNHTESRRGSCCSHSSEQQLLLTAQDEYSAVLLAETSAVTDQLGPESRFRDHFKRMLAISKRMTEYELGFTLNLPHTVGREAVENFYAVVENILIPYDRSTSVFSAMDNLLDNLFAYVVREATTPGSREEPDPKYYTCLKTNRRILHPSPFPESLVNQATTLHYSAVAASYLSESMDAIYQALNITRDLDLSPHCLRDLMKLNHCQKCYGYTKMKPCRAFCEDIYLVCLNRVVRLDMIWEYHRKVVKMLAAYILTRVDPQPLLNTFHTNLKANIDKAILSYSSYKHQLEALCGAPTMVTHGTRNRIKVWEKPTTTSYEGDFSGDLRKLVVNLELKVPNFYSTLHSSICSSEPTDGECWEGLTERVNKKKNRLDFVDEFAPYPDVNPDVSEVMAKIKRIRNDVLKIFIKSNKPAEETVEGSGSGDGPDPPDDTETGDDDEVPIKPLNTDDRKVNTVTGTIKEKMSLSYVPERSENSIKITEEVKTTPKTTTSFPRKDSQSDESSGVISRVYSTFLCIILVSSYIL